jgi:hypothetical protein
MLMLLNVDIARDVAMNVTVAEGMTNSIADIVNSDTADGDTTDGNTANVNVISITNNNTTNITKTYLTYAPPAAWFAFTRTPTPQTVPVPRKHAISNKVNPLREVVATDNTEANLKPITR